LKKEELQQMKSWYGDKGMGGGDGR
jgi:hypothetical protein